MNQEYVNKLVEWIKANRNYSAEQLQQSALQGGSSIEDFNAALNIANAPVVSLVYKGVGIRFLALIVDGIIFGIIYWLITSLFSDKYVGGCDSNFSFGSSISFNGEKTFYGLCGLSAQFFDLILLAYYVVFEWKLGGTIGKLATGMRVIKSTGEPLDLKSSLIRNVLRIVDFLPFFYFLGAISIWSSKTKQRIGDRLAKTVVVDKYSIK